MKRFFVLSLMFLISGCGFMAGDSDEVQDVVIQQLSEDQVQELFADNFVVKRKQPVDLSVLDGRFQAKEQEGQIFVYFDSKVIEKFDAKAADVFNLQEHYGRFVTYEVKDRIVSFYKLFDTELKRFYKVRSIANIYYDDLVNKLVACDTYKQDGFGNLDVVDLRLNEVDQYFSRQQNAYLVDCSGFSEDTKQYEFAAIMQNELAALKNVSKEDGFMTFEDEVLIPKLGKPYINAHGALEGDWKEIDWFAPRVSKRAVNLGYSLDSRYYLLDEDLSKEDLIWRYFHYLSRGPKHAYKMLINPSVDQDSFLAEVNEYGHLDLIKVSLVSEDVYTAIVKWVSLKGEYDFYKFNLKLDGVKLEILSKETLKDYEIDTYANARIVYKIKDGQDMILFDDQFVTASCEEGMDDRFCSLVSFDDFEMLTDQVFSFRKQGYEGYNVYLLNLETGKIISDYIFLIEEEKVTIKDNMMWGCIEPGMLGNELFVFDLDSFEFVKRESPQRSINKCLGYNQQKAGYEYVLADYNDDWQQDFKNFENYVNSLEPELFTLED